MKQCKPTTYSKYAESRTEYSSSQIRCFTLLVETSDFKIPKESTLGKDFNPLQIQGPGNGHVPRNIRLSLLATDIVEPYVQLSQNGSPSPSRTSFRSVAAGDILKDRLIEELPFLGLVQKERILLTNEWEDNNAPDVHFQWNIGGCVEVDASSLGLFQWDPLISFSVLDKDENITKQRVKDASFKLTVTGSSRIFRASRQAAKTPFAWLTAVNDAVSGRNPIFEPSKEGRFWWPSLALSQKQEEQPSKCVQDSLFHRSPSVKGKCRWGKLTKQSEGVPEDASFSHKASIHRLSQESLESFLSIDVDTAYGNFSIIGMVAVGVAVTDQEWANAEDVTPPRMDPQTHLVRVRTDPSYNATNNRFTILGKWHFSSKPQGYFIIRRRGGSKSEPNSIPPSKNCNLPLTGTASASMIAVLIMVCTRNNY